MCESLPIDCLTGQGLGKDKIGRLLTKRSKREVGELSEWVQSVKAVVFYVNAPQRTSTAKKTLTNLPEIRGLIPRMSVSFPHHLVFAHWIHGSRDALRGFNRDLSSSRM